MAKTKYILRAVPAGTPEAGETVTVKDVAAVTQASPTTDANGIATYEVDGSVGPLIASATVGSRTVYRDGRSIDQMGTWFPQDIPRALRVLGNGVIPGYTGPGIEAEDMQVTPGTGLQVLVGEGVILLDGHLYGCTASTPLTIGANASGSTRYDRVVARFTREGQTTEGKFVLAILAGTPGAGDGAALTKSDVTYEFSLARITVVNGAASFVSGDIVDERYSTSLNQAYVFTNPNAFDAATTGYRAGDTLYVNSAGKLTRLAKGTDGQVLRLSSGLPGWGTQLITVADVSDLTASAAELNTLDGITSTVTELNYTDGVTSAIQTQIDGKAATSHAHAGADITSGTVAIARLPTGTTGSTVSLGNHTHLLAAGATDVTASAAELNILDGATLTVTELNYVDGVTSAIQTQIDGKAATSHNHAGSAITSGTVGISYLPTGVSGSHVSLGNHTHTGVYSAVGHTHIQYADTTGAVFSGDVTVGDGASLLVGSTSPATISNSSGSLAIDSNLVIGTATTGGKIRLPERTSKPTVALGAAGGTGGSAGASIIRGGSDSAGVVRCTAGTTSLTTGVILSVTFQTARATNEYGVQITGQSTDSDIGLVAANVQTTGFDVRCNVAPGSGDIVDIFYTVLDLV